MRSEEISRIFYNKKVEDSKFDLWYCSKFMRSEEICRIFQKVKFKIPICEYCSKFMRWMKSAHFFLFFEHYNFITKTTTILQTQQQQ